MLVSVIMPCFNSSGFISKAIESVIAQTYPYWELIVVDNGSQDETVQIVNGYCEKDKRVNIHHEREKGSASARNKGIANASGRYLAFLDSDDIWDSEKLELTISFMVIEKARLACTGYIPFYSDSARKFGKRIPRKVIDKRDLLKTCDIGCSTVIIDVSFFESNDDIPRFPNVGKEDYAYWFDLIDIYNQPFRGFPGILTQYRVHSSGVSSNKTKEIILQYNVYRHHLRMNFFESCLFLMSYIVYGIRKTYLND